jgi:hypothetical protein
MRSITGPDHRLVARRGLLGTELPFLGKAMPEFPGALFDGRGKSHLASEMIGCDEIDAGLRVVLADGAKGPKAQRLNIMQGSAVAVAACPVKRGEQRIAHGKVGVVPGGVGKTIGRLVPDDLFDFVGD